MTYRELKKRLEAAGIPDAETDARMLLCSVAGVTPAAQRADPDREYPSPELERAVRRRENREPLQYILGSWQFFGQTYEVSPDCLIPRADTEVLVEKAIALLPENARFADLRHRRGEIPPHTGTRKTQRGKERRFLPFFSRACRRAPGRGHSGRYPP